MKNTILLIISFLIIQLLVGTIIAFGFQAIAQPLGIDVTETKTWSLGFSLLLSNLIMIGLTYAILKRKEENNPFATCWRLPSDKVSVLTLIALFLLVFPVNALIELTDVPDLMESLISGMIQNPLCIITICIIGPIAEEFVFRRGVLGSLLETDRFSKYALVISALLFALIHANPAQMVGAFLLGLFLGWIYLKSNSLVLPIACHIINNSVSIILVLCFGEDAKIQNLFSSSTAFYIAIVLSVVLFALLYRPLSKILSKK